MNLRPLNRIDFKESAYLSGRSYETLPAMNLRPRLHRSGEGLFFMLKVSSAATSIMFSWHLSVFLGEALI